MNTHNKNSNFEKKQIITGIWKFEDTVSEADLVQVANEWVQDPKYLQLYIRKVSKNQNGIGFMYDDQDSTDSEKSYDTFFNQVTDKLKRQFGNDLVGWDVSSSTIIIK